MPAQQEAASEHVTGFGLLGHLGRMTLESGVDVELRVRDVPLIPGARALAEQGFVPGGSRRNLDWARERLDVGSTDETAVLMLADAQTSGGLLFGADPGAAEQAVATLRAAGHDTAVVWPALREKVLGADILLISTRSGRVSPPASARWCSSASTPRSIYQSLNDVGYSLPSDPGLSDT